MLPNYAITSVTSYYFYTYNVNIEKDITTYKLTASLLFLMPIGKILEEDL